MDAEVAVVGAGRRRLRPRRSRSPGAASRSPCSRRSRSPALAASGTNSGILHTGFDSIPGELETELILRSAELREPVLDALGVPVLRCGAVMRPGGRGRASAVAAPGRERAPQRRPGRACARTARSRCPARRSPIRSPSRSPSPPPHARHGAELRTGSSVCGVERDAGRDVTLDERRRRAAALPRRWSTAPGCGADEVARPGRRRLVRRLSAQGRVPRLRAAGGRALDRILLPVPSRGHQGGARVPDPRRQGRRRADRGRPGGQGRLVGAARGPRRDPAEGGRDATRRSRAPSRSPPTPGCGRRAAASTT